MPSMTKVARETPSVDPSIAAANLDIVVDTADVEAARDDVVKPNMFTGTTPGLYLPSRRVVGPGFLNHHSPRL